MLSRKNVEMFVADLIENAQQLEKKPEDAKQFIGKLRTRHPAMCAATVADVLLVVTVGDLLGILEATGD